MEIPEMSNEQLFRNYVCTKRELKTLQSTMKQIETEIENRYDKGILAEKISKQENN